MLPNDIKTLNEQWLTFLSQEIASAFFQVSDLATLNYISSLLNYNYFQNNQAINLNLLEVADGYIDLLIYCLGAIFKLSENKTKNHELNAHYLQLKLNPYTFGLALKQYDKYLFNLPLKTKQAYASFYSTIYNEVANWNLLRQNTKFDLVNELAFLLEETNELCFSQTNKKASRTYGLNTANEILSKAKNLPIKIKENYLHTLPALTLIELQSVYDTWLEFFVHCFYGIIQQLYLLSTQFNLDIEDAIYQVLNANKQKGKTKDAYGKILKNDDFLAVENNFKYQKNQEKQD